MKKRLKGLVSLWLVVVMVCSMMTVPAMAADPVYVMVSTADTSPVPGQWHDPFEWANLEFDTPLVQQSEIMEKCPIPAGGVMNGWRLWSATSGGYVSSSIPSQTIGKNDGINSNTWSVFADNMNNYLMIEPLWSVKYRINPQPTKADPTVGGKVYDEATTTWSKTEDVTYQWYEVTTDSKDYTVVETASADDQLSTTNIYEGSYADGIWNSTDNGVLDILFSVQAGDVVTVTPSDGFSGSVKEYYSYTEYTAANGSYTMTTTADGAHDLYITSTSSEAFTATVTVTRSATTYTLLNGQTTKTLDLTKIEAGTYACELTFNPSKDNVVMMSDTVTYTEEELTPNYIVWVGGQGMYASTDGTVVTYYTNGADGAAGTVSATKPEQWHAKLYYDTASNAYTLEINGLDATGIADDADSFGAGIYSTVPLALSFAGTNTVDGSTNSNTSYGIHVPGLTVTGADGASLTVNSVDSSNSYGIYSTAPVTINSGTISAYAGVASGDYSHAIHAVGGFVLNDGNVTAQSSNAPTRSSAIYSAQSSTSAADGSIFINGGTLTARSTSTNWVKYSHAISAQGAITINGGTINATSGSAYHTSCGIHACVTDFPDDQYNGCSDAGCASPITINGGVITARTEGDTFQSQNRAIYSHDIVTITDGNVTAISNGEATDDFSYGLGGYNGIHISGGTVTAQGDTGGGSMFSAGLYCDWDLIISGDAHIIATGGAARVYSYGTYCWRNFHMSGDAYLRSVADITTTPNPEEIHDDNPRRSIGLYMSAGVYEPSTPVVDDYFTITGGTLEAWCVTSEESCSTENYAVKMFDVVNDDFIFSDSNQTNKTWYKWTLETDDDGAPVNMIWSTKTQYVHADDKENYKSTYLYITPMEEIHEVTFNSMGGSEVTPNPVEVEHEAKVAKPADPTKTNHSFLGWFTSGDNGVTLSDEEYDFSTPVVSDLTLYAQWKEIPQYTVTYDLNGGTGAEGVDYTTQTVDEGTKITVKEDPSLAGHRFDSWSDGTNDRAAGDEITVNSDITLTAQWVKQYTVTYDLNGGTGAEGVDYTTKTVDAGTKIIVKAEPSLAGHRFDCWSDGTTNYAADDEITVESDITLTAQWVKQYTVTLDSNGADLIMEINGIAAGESANEAFNRQAGTEAKDAGKALAPTRDGYTFDGWYTDKGTWKNKYDFDSKVTADITVYAKWEEAAPPVVDPPVIDPPVVISGTASLTKVDAEDPATVLSGVVFELYRLDGALMGTYTTNAYGQITVYGLVPGTYYWRETRPAEGYVLDGTERVFTVYAGQTTSLVVENERSGVPGVFSGDHYAYVIGYDDGMVHPEANITRAEVATIFFRLLDEETRARYMTRSNSFSDVEEGMWFNTAVSTMAAMGIVTGRPDGTFDPNANITRAEFAAIAARFDANGNTTDASFTDIYGHWAMKEINIAANNGWVLGYEDGSFRPNQLITRAEAMTMVNRVLQRIPEHPEDLLDHMVTWPDNMDTSKWYYLMVQEATNSHDYHRKGNGYEYWTGLRQVPDWAALEN